MEAREILQRDEVLVAEDLAPIRPPRLDGTVEPVERLAEVAVTAQAAGHVVGAITSFPSGNPFVACVTPPKACNEIRGVSP